MWLSLKLQSIEYLSWLTIHSQSLNPYCYQLLAKVIAIITINCRYSWLFLPVITSICKQPTKYPYTWVINGNYFIVYLLSDMPLFSMQHIYMHGRVELLLQCDLALVWTPAFDSVYESWRELNYWLKYVRHCGLNKKTLKILCHF